MITLNEGSGGRQMQILIEKIRDKLKLKDKWNNINDDAATLKLKNNKHLVFTTDSYTVNPVFFPGGDIGSLAVAGTVNDISAVGAEPAAISCALILQEGFPIDELESILESMSETSKLAGVPVVTGDTKVVERGALDGMFINTSGIGFGGDAEEIETGLSNLNKTLDELSS